MRDRLHMLSGSDVVLIVLCLQTGGKMIMTQGCLILHWCSALLVHCLWEQNYAHGGFVRALHTGIRAER